MPDKIDRLRIEMLVFIDESYEKDSNGVWHYALAGFGINEFRYRALQAAVYQLVLDSFGTRDDFDGDGWKDALNEKIIIESSLEHMELKSGQLLKAGSLRRFGGINSPHYKLVANVLQEVYDCRGTTIGVLLNPSHPNDVKSTVNGCPPAYQCLLEVVGNWMQESYEGQAVTLVMDTEHNGINLPLSRAISKFMYRSAIGKRMKHVFPAPFWIDSQSLAGAQIADLVAHILMNAMKPDGERKHLDGLTEQVYSLSQRWKERSGQTIVRI